MQRRAAIPLGLVWLLTVLGTWVLTTAAVAALLSTRTGRSTMASLVGQSALSATLACVVVSGPATAVALRVRRYQGLGTAVLAGLAVAALILLFIWSYMAAAGTALRDPWGAVTPALAVTIVQLALAFAVRGRRQAASPPPPPPSERAGSTEPAGEPEPAGEAETGRLAPA